MQTMYDVQQLLKRFAIFIYTGNRLSDLELMEVELRQLYEAKVVSMQEFQQALMVIRSEKAKMRKDSK